MRSAERCTRRSLLDGSLRCPVRLGLLPKGTELSQRSKPASLGGMNSSVLSYLITSGTGADNGYKDRGLKPAVFCV
ncbi:hypothetical protein HP552_09740 [Paenibacillus xylanilyticus]|uniref:Uncharacterized protein n=1 Tax=Paenibacillus xylanilyticus TaxID=248903 RepID=A0A7Y6BW25_9BACL|nr:hypothetical protein [Paenibacillus xylanilyticus]